MRRIRFALMLALALVVMMSTAACDVLFGDDATTEPEVVQPDEAAPPDADSTLNYNTVTTTGAAFTITVTGSDERTMTPADTELFYEPASGGDMYIQQGILFEDRNELYQIAFGSIPPDVEPGTYSLGDSEPPFVFYASTITFLAEDTEPDAAFYSDNVTGTLNITENDGSQISGTFEFSAEDNAVGRAVTVSGEFSGVPTTGP